MAQYLHRHNCSFGFIWGFGTQLLMKAEGSQLPLVWRGFRPRAGGSTFTQNLAKCELLENMLACSD